MVEKERNNTTKFVPALDKGDEMFEEEEENRVFSVYKKALNLQNKLKSVQGNINAAKIMVQKYRNMIKSQWPGLFDNPQERIYVHVDLDSFYAAVETLLNPAYKNVPLAVGSKMMIAAASYLAREYNVKAGIPGYQAKLLCPHLVITKCQFDQYNYYSEIVMGVLSQYNPKIEIYGIDEACLIFDDNLLRKSYERFNNSTKYGKLPDEKAIDYKEFSFDSVWNLVEKIREVIYRKTGGLTISAGISVCRGLAKFSSGLKKPNGQFMITEKIDEFLFGLNVDKVNGIGKMTKILLNKALNIVTIKDLREKLPECFLLFPQKTFENIMKLSFGLSLFDNSFYSSKSTKAKKYNEYKSIGNSLSIKPTVDYKTVCDVLWHMSSSICYRMTKQGVYSRVITLRIKYSNFAQITRQKKVTSLIKTTEEIFNLCIELFKEDFNVDKTSGFKILINEVRMIGASVSSLISSNACMLLKRYQTPEKINYKIRKCFICGKDEIYPNFHSFQVHVNKCVNDIEAKDKKNKKGIVYLLEKYKKTE